MVGAGKVMIPQDMEILILRMCHCVAQCMIVEANGVNGSFRLGKMSDLSLTIQDLG